MKNWYTKINFKKSKEFISQGTERILIREYRRSYKTTTPIFEVDLRILVNYGCHLLYLRFDILDDFLVIILFFCHGKSWIFFGISFTK
nr:palindromic element RPE5 domain-containing protein [Rickettsia tamurae]